MDRSYRLHLLSLLLPTVVSMASASAIELKFTPIDVNNDPTSGTSVYDINNDGVMVGNYAAGLDALGFITVDGFVAHRGVFDNVALPGAGLSPNPPFGANYLGEVAAINDDGTGVGDYGDAQGKSHGFLRTARGRIIQLPDLPYQISGYFGINKVGTVTGFYDGKGNLNAADFHGFVFDGEDYTTIDYPASSGTILARQNDRGDTAGWWFDNGGAAHGLLFDGKNFTAIDYPGASQTFAQAVNNKGTVVGIYTDANGDHGFL